MTVPVYFDPAIINAGAKPKQTAGETPRTLKSVWWPGKLKWVWWTGMPLIVNGIVSKDKSLEDQRDYLSGLYTSSEAYRLRDMVLVQP